MENVIFAENKEATSYQIEHLVPHRGDKQLKYSWENLFWVCCTLQ